MISPSVVPNTLTALNLSCGVLSIIKAIEKDFLLSGVFILLAMLADAFDGRAARYFKVSGEFGKELDSLSDVVSFGVAPAILIYQMHFKEFTFPFLFVTVVFAVCAEMRLARFNVDVQNVEGYFMGLPSPAAGCTLATFAISGIMIDPVYVAAGTLITGLLMYSKVRYPDFKGKGNPIKKPAVLVGVIWAAYMLYTFPLIALPFIGFFAYLSVGIVNYIYVQFTGGY